MGDNINMKEIKQKDFDQETGTGAAVVDFFGTGCINCKMTEPILAALAADNPDIKFIKINTDTAPKLVDRFGINSLPTVLFMKDGAVKQTLVGLKPRGVIARMIQDFL
jgi:thioredoxin 1